MGRLLNIGKTTEFSYLYTASVRCPIPFSPQFVNVQEEAACQAQRSPSALQLFQLLLSRPGFLLLAACPSLPLGSFLTRGPGFACLADLSFKLRGVWCVSILPQATECRKCWAPGSDRPGWSPFSWLPSWVPLLKAPALSEKQGSCEKEVVTRISKHCWELG